MNVDTEKITKFITDIYETTGSKLHTHTTTIMVFNNVDINIINNLVESTIKYSMSYIIKTQKLYCIYLLELKRLCDEKFNIISNLQEREQKKQQFYDLIYFYQKKSRSDIFSLFKILGQYN